MASDFLLITDEDKQIIYESEFDADSVSPLAIFIAYASISVDEISYENNNVFIRPCNRFSSKIIFVTNRSSNTNIVRKFLEEIEISLNRFLLNLNYNDKDYIDSEDFDTKIRESYVNNILSSK